MDESVSQRQWSCFLAERFLPRSTPAGFSASAARDYEAARRASISLVQTIYVPDDETCFSLFAGADAHEVIRFGEDNHLNFLRVLEAISISGNH